MPRIKPKPPTNIFTNVKFSGKLWPYGSKSPVNPADARGWVQYRDRNFKVLQKFAPLPEKYIKFDKEVIKRSLRVEREVQPHKVWKNLQFKLKLDYLKMAKMVLVFHNYGLNAQEQRKIRQVAKNARCEWVQDKTLGELYATHIGDDSLRPLLVDGDAVFWVAYNFDEYKYITEKIEPFKYSFKLVAGLMVNPEFHSYRLLLPSQLAAFGTLPTTKAYIGDKLLGPMMAQPYFLVSTLMGSIAQLNNVLQYHLFKMKQAQKDSPKAEEKGEKGAQEEAKGEKEEKVAKSEEKGKTEEKAEKKEGKPEAKGAKGEEKGEKKEAKEGAPKAEAKAEKQKGGEKGEKGEKPKGGEQKK